MTLKSSVQAIAEEIETDLSVEDAAKIFAACVSRLVADGRPVLEVYQRALLAELDGDEQDEAAEWLADLIPKE